MFEPKFKAGDKVITPYGTKGVVQGKRGFFWLVYFDYPRDEVLEEIEKNDKTTVH